MAAIDDFKKQLKAGKIIDAFQTALSEAAELEITTWVSSPESPNPEESQPGDRLRTRINIIEGHIDNEVGAEFVGDGAYKELQQLHISQVQESHKIIQNNLNSLQKLFGLLAKVHRLNPDVTTVEITGDITTITGTETGLHELVFVPPVSPPAGLLKEAKLPDQPEPSEPWEPFIVPYPPIIIDGNLEETGLDEDLSYFADDATGASSTPTLVTDVGWEELVANETPLDISETPIESEDWIPFNVVAPTIELPETTTSDSPTEADANPIAFDVATPAIELPATTTEDSATPSSEDSGNFNIAVPVVAALGTVAAVAALGTLAANQSSTEEAAPTDTSIAEPETLSASGEADLGDLNLQESTATTASEPVSVEEDLVGDLALGESTVVEPSENLAIEGEAWSELGFEELTVAAVSSDPFATTEEDWEEFTTEEVEPTATEPLEVSSVSTEETSGNSNIAATAAVIGLGTLAAAVTLGTLATHKDEKSLTDTPVAEPESLLASTDDEEWGDIGLEDPLPSPIAEPESLLTSTDDEEWGDIGLEDPLPYPVAEPESLLASTDDEEWGDIALEDPIAPPLTEPETLLSSADDEEWGNIGLEDPLPSPVAEPETLLSSTDEEWGDISLEDPIPSPVAEPESLLSSTDEEWGDISLEDPIPSPIAEPETLLSSTDEEWGDLSGYEQEVSPLTIANDFNNSEQVDDGWENLVLDETDPFTGAATTNSLSAEPAVYEEWQELVLEEELPSTQTDFDGLGGKADAALNFEEPDSYVDLMESLDANPFGDPLGGDAAELLELTSAESQSSNLSFDEFLPDPLQDSFEDFSLESLTEEIPSLDDSDPFGDLILDDDLGLPPLPPPPPPPPPHR